MKTITKDIIKAAKFASTDKDRPILTAVKITDKGYAATDSYKLIMIKNKGADINDFPIVNNTEPVKEISKPLLIPAKDILAKLKFPKNKNLSILEGGLLCNETDKLLSIATTDLETSNILQLHKVEGDFPEYQKIVPIDKPIASIKVNPTLLIECLEAFTDEKENSVTIDLFGKYQPLIMTGADKTNDHIKALLMPKR